MGNIRQRQLANALKSFARRNDNESLNGSFDSRRVLATAAPFAWSLEAMHAAGRA